MKLSCACDVQEVTERWLQHVLAVAYLALLLGVQPADALFQRRGPPKQPEVHLPVAEYQVRFRCNPKLATPLQLPRMEWQSGMQSSSHMLPAAASCSYAPCRRHLKMTYRAGRYARGC